MVLAAVHHRQPVPQLDRAQALRSQAEVLQANSVVVRDDVGIRTSRVYHLLRSDVNFIRPETPITWG